MFGFTPILKVMETKDWHADFAIYTTSGPGCYRMNHEIANHNIPLATQEWLRAIPEYSTLPFEDGTVKWPDDLSLPVEHTRARVDNVRLANSLPFARELGWQNDGGQSYSAQYYVSAAVDASQVPTLDRWAVPHQVNYPAAPAQIAFEMLPAPLQNFMRPGFVNTGALNTYNNYAHGISIPNAERSFAKIATKGTNECTRVRPTALSTFVPEGSRRYSYETIVSIAVPKARYDNLLIMSMNRPNVGVPQYTTAPIEAAMTQPRRALAGPASEANDTQLGQGTQGMAKFKRVSTIGNMVKGRKGRLIQVDIPQSARTEKTAGTPREKSGLIGDRLAEEMNNSDKRNQGDHESKPKVYDHKETPDEYIARKEANKAKADAYAKRQEAKIEAAKRQSDNEVPLKRQARNSSNEPKGKTDNKESQKYESKKGQSEKWQPKNQRKGGGFTIEEPEHGKEEEDYEEEKIADSHSSDVEKFKRLEMNAETKESIEKAKGSDDNIRDLGSLSRDIQLSTSGLVPIITKLKNREN
jgi:hypothetical protein